MSEVREGLQQTRTYFIICGVPLFPFNQLKHTPAALDRQSTDGKS